MTTAHRPEWPSALIPSDPPLPEIEDLLTRWRVGGPHYMYHREPLPGLATHDFCEHRGYEVVSCRQCGKPTIRARGTDVVVCGREFEDRG